jgi:hypothetical protein
VGNQADIVLLNRDFYQISSEIRDYFQGLDLEKEIILLFYPRLADYGMVINFLVFVIFLS